MKNTEISQDLLTGIKDRYSKPSKYNVLLLGEDNVSMDFIVSILQLCFRKSHESSIKLMLKFRNEGQVVCGTYTKEVAETKSDLVKYYCKESKHDIRCIIKKSD